MRLGFYPDAPKKPFVPGYEVSGYVDAVGKDVSTIAAGDPVVAGTFFGGYASHVTVDEDQVLKLPEGFDLKEGAALPVNFFTAYVALFEMARVRAGDRVLIECATGGVGTLAMQMAKQCGAEVVGLTSSKHKKSHIERFGAQAFTTQEFYANESIGKFDFILNASGGANIKRQLPFLVLTGRMVCMGLNSGVVDGKRNFFRIARAAIQTPRLPVLRMFDPNIGVFGLNALKILQDKAWVARLSTAFSQIEAHNIRPHIDRVFQAEEVASAHRYLESKQATGKILLAWQ
jgi:NADPH:quinone reductase-like Zn-dependent oxidoreductase